LVARIDSETEAFRSVLAAMGSSLERVDPFALARSVFDTWAVGVREKGVEVTVRIGERSPMLLMHRPSIRSALENILNVLGAHVDKGDRVLLEASHTEDRVVLMIADTAGKLDGTLLSRLFMPFVTSSEDPDPGAMSVAGDILQRHAGEITVKSSPSWKTILAISFPVASNRDRRESRKDRRHHETERRKGE
jgi:K+-sensing histidine kinase KdpD